MTDHTTQCPICFSNRFNSVGPLYYICGKCGITFNDNFKSRAYDNNYFLEEYQAQYGKTYIQDFENITSISLKRLEIILKHVTKEPQSLALLEIGSAAGFFLQCAKGKGIKNLIGIEISNFAASYCRDKFNIPVIQSSFEDIPIHQPYDIIATWFFIEHCANPGRVMHKIYDSLADGGVFAFSGPSIFGPLYAFNRKSWLKTHPPDHRIDFSPRAVKKILTSLGFTRVYIRASGIHPERILSEKSVFFRPFSIIYRIFSSAMAFSDTIEVYAIK